MILLFLICFMSLFFFFQVSWIFDTLTAFCQGFQKHSFEPWWREAARWRTELLSAAEPDSLWPTEWTKHCHFGMGFLLGFFFPLKFQSIAKVVFPVICSSLIQMLISDLRNGMWRLNDVLRLLCGWSFPLVPWHRWPSSCEGSPSPPLAARVRH